MILLLAVKSLQVTEVNQTDSSTRLDDIIRVKTMEMRLSQNISV